MSRKIQESFFEVYAHEYDILTNAKQREAPHGKEVQTLIDKFRPTKVLDAGCATGLTTHIFAEKGIRTVGIDRSRPMIKIAKEKYDGTDDNLSFQYGNFEKLPKSMYNSFDMVVCLANSISGVGSLNNLNKAIQNFHLVLRPGGYLVIQLLNYYSIRDKEFRAIKATRNGDIFYQRFSERQGKRLYIYVNRLDISKPELKYEMFRHVFENFNPQEMVSTLKHQAFTSILRYSDLYLNRPFIKTARDLVLTAQKK